MEVTGKPSLNKQFMKTSLHNPLKIFVFNNLNLCLKGCSKHSFFYYQLHTTDISY